MLQKGIIEKLEGKYAARVRVPKYDKLNSSDNGTDTKDLPVGIVCALPEMKITYSVGDVVLVAYENDELSKPVILGLLYRDSESESTSELPYIEDTISEINDKLTTLEDQNMYMHVKYSNDNGATFTSLFDYSTIAEDEIGFYVYSPMPIEIDPTTEMVQWNIIDSNNIDVTDKFIIETAIDGVNSKTGYEIHNTYDKSLFKLQVLTEACDTVTISFNIKATKEILSNYYISLSTDKISIGDTYGDYIGICTSTESTPSLNTSDYTWTSVREREDLKISSVTDDILDRVRRNEQDLRGYSEDVKDESGSIITSGTGLLDAINVGLDYILIGQDRNLIYFANSDQMIDVGSSALHINSIIQNEFQFERYAIITDIQGTIRTPEEYKPEFIPDTTYYTKSGNTYTEAVGIEGFADETIYYTYDDDSATYEQVYVEFRTGQTYYTRSGSGTVEDPYRYTEETSETPRDETIYYVMKSSTGVVGQSVEPHLRLILTD